MTLISTHSKKKLKVEFKFWATNITCLLVCTCLSSAPEKNNNSWMDYIAIWWQAEISFYCRWQLQPSHDWHAFNRSLPWRFMVWLNCTTHWLDSLWVIEVLVASVKAMESYFHTGTRSPIEACMWNCLTLPYQRISFLYIKYIWCKISSLNHFNVFYTWFLEYSDISEWSSRNLYFLYNI